MPANAKVSTSSTVDTSATRLAGSIDGMTWPYSYVQTVRLQAGAQPSYAILKIPVEDVDSTAPAVAGVASGPKDSIKQGAPAFVAAINGSTFATLFDGVVTQVEERFSASEDFLLVKIEDERERMRKWPIIGSFWMSGSTGYSYRQGWRLHPNAGGQPNCIWRSTDAGYVPMMCSPWYGVGADEDPAEDTAQDVTKACYWTSRSLLQYFRFLTTSTAYTAATTTGDFAFFPAWPDSVVWPEGFHNAIEVSSGDDRKAKEMVYDGMNMLDAVEKVLSDAGPYSLYTNPDPPDTDSDDNTWKTTLTVIRTRYNDGEATLLRPTSGGAASTLGKARVVLAGSIKESAQNLYTRVAVGGDLVFIEARVHSTAANDGDLREAWDSDTETAFSNYIATRYNAGDTISDATKKAARKYPHVGAAYRLDHDYYFASGTSEDAKPIASVPRPVLPHLLSSYLEAEDSSPSGDELRRFRRPVLFEYQDSDDDAGTDPWFLAEESDGLAVDADGTIWVPALRDNETTLVVSTSGSVPSATVSLELRKLRCTLAIPCDHRYTKSQKLAMDEADLEAGAIQSQDAHRIKSGLDYAYYADTPDLYGLEIRNGAWPIPGAVNGSSSQSDTIRDDGDLLQSHVDRRMRDFGRLDRSGQLILRNMLTAIRPGLEIKALDTGGGADEDDESGMYPLNVVVVAMTWSNANQNGSSADGTPGQFVSVEVL